MLPERSDRDTLLRYGMAAKIAVFTMVALRSRIVSQRHFAWLLWLALLLPVAQAAATWHALSHIGRDASSEVDGKLARHVSHCDLCLTAAAVTGGALPGTPPSVPHPAARHQAPLALPALAYLSRAPPLFRP